MSTHILIVEDDEDIAGLVAFRLEREGWHTSIVHHGTEAWKLICEQIPDCVILDMMLPGMNGLEIFQAMQANPHTSGIPTLFLTAKAQTDDRLEALALGADDYITKPFSTKELILRVRNILKRANQGATQMHITAGPISLDKNSLQATLNGEPLELTTSEFKLLAYLLERPRKIQERYKLQNLILGYADTTQTRALDTHIKRLRQKLGTHATCIVTERGIGYYYSPEE